MGAKIHIDMSFTLSLLCSVTVGHKKFKKSNLDVSCIHFLVVTKYYVYIKIKSIVHLLRELTCHSKKIKLVVILRKK